MIRQRFDAVLFDMDGTLIDSEGLTERAIGRVLADLGLPTSQVDFARFHGITWEETAILLEETFPQLSSKPLAELLPQEFQKIFVVEFPQLISGAREAVMDASRHLPTGIVTSASRMSVEHVLDELDLRSHCGVFVCAEDCSRSKPDPQGYLLAAERLAVPPSGCLVFEDSLVGLRAAKAAGMTALAISCGVSDAQRATQRELADGTLSDFRELPADFFAAAAQRERP